MTIQELQDQKDCKPFFMYLLQSMAEMLGPDMAKGTLQRVGENLADTLVKRLGDDSLNFTSFDEILTKPNPLNYFDDTLKIHKDGIMILEKCPFSKQIRDYLNIVGTNPQVFAEITELYNTEGSGYAVSPYCIIHQTFRTAIANRIKIGGKPVELLHLGCKSFSNKILLATKNVEQEKVSTQEIDTNLKTHSLYISYKTEILKNVKSMLKSEMTKMVENPAKGCELSLRYFTILNSSGQACISVCFDPEIEPQIFSSFFAAIFMYGKQSIKEQMSKLSIESKNTRTESIVFMPPQNPENFLIGIGIVSKDLESTTFHHFAEKNLRYFEEEYRPKLVNWDGDISLFEPFQILMEAEIKKVFVNTGKDFECQMDDIFNKILNGDFSGLDKITK